MKNSEKYKTAQKRAEAFTRYCDQMHREGSHRQFICKIDKPCPRCTMEWLDLECEEEKPLPCPFCEKEVEIRKCIDGHYWNAHCIRCGYVSSDNVTKDEAISAHNRVAKAVRESEGK